MRFIGVSTDEQIGFLEKPKRSQFVPDDPSAPMEHSDRARTLSQFSTTQTQSDGWSVTSTEHSDDL